jgi:hypothetical protein
VVANYYFLYLQFISLVFISLIFINLLLITLIFIVMNFDNHQAHNHLFLFWQMLQFDIFLLPNFLKEVMLKYSHLVMGYLLYYLLIISLGFFVASLNLILFRVHNNLLFLLLASFVSFLFGIYGSILFE